MPKFHKFPIIQNLYLIALAVGFHLVQPGIVSTLHASLTKGRGYVQHATTEAAAWAADAAYFYILHLDGQGVAWEHLRRNPGYRAAWEKFGHNQTASSQAQAWGLRFFRRSGT